MCIFDTKAEALCCPIVATYRNAIAIVKSPMEKIDGDVFLFLLFR
jgi:hypothetical protein